MVPRHETGNVTNSVSSRASSNPSPMYFRYQKDALFVGRNRCELLSDSLTNLLPAPASQDHQVTDPARQLISEPLEVPLTFSQDQR